MKTSKTELVSIIKILCAKLDDIETYSDLCIDGGKHDDQFRKILHKAAAWRDCVQTDGYDLFLNGEKI